MSAELTTDEAIAHLCSELATATARNRRMHEALDELIAACDETYDSKPYDVAMASARAAHAEGAE